MLSIEISSLLLTVMFWCWFGIIASFKISIISGEKLVFILLYLAIQPVLTTSLSRIDSGG